MDAQKKTYRGRIAPTPSGFLHIGHLQTFKTACARAKKCGGKIVLRIEDIDSARCKKEYIEQIFTDLKNAGIEWDEGPGKGGNFAPYAQSQRFDLYKKRLEELIEKKKVYPCFASRAQIKEKAKICPGNGEAIFPIELRPKKWEMPRDIFKCNWRFMVGEASPIEFFDEMCGAQKFIPQRDFGDFLVWRKSGEPSYELAVVADDIAMEITEVVRGMDLLVSTARQILLYRAFGAEIPKFAHCPLILDESGKKLSKSVLKNFFQSEALIKNLRKPE
ncbi:MAG: tRNA glutamyl-Q synthetase [Opitutales bacterium]|nr:tRNA glutamyl-Q synthetase [Opitutales bacterium]